MASRPDQLALGVQLRDSSVFASYYAGRNQPAVEILKRVRRAEAPTCIWLQGGIGSGKTHLLQALCVQAELHGERAAYLPLAQFRSFGAQLLNGFGQLDCVCLDDVECIVGQDDWERSLFGLYRELDEQRGRLIVSSNLPPGAVSVGLRDLSSRLAGGLVLTLQPLDEIEQVAALQLHAQLRGIELPDETAQFLLRRLPRDMASLCAFLVELDQASLAAQRRLTIPFVRGVLAGLNMR